MTRLKNLSHIDFEDLSRDVAQVLTGQRFSAFGPGPDGGIDGRHAKGDSQTVLQSKHYAGSTFSQLKRAVNAEISKLDVLKPSRYLLLTSQSLTPDKVQKLSAILGDHLQSTDDILGLEDIEGVLRNNPELEKSHMKLWLSSAAVLDRLLHAGLEEFTNATKEEILDDLKVYVRNESFDEAVRILEREKILIVSGPPGVGKTTLAKMVAYHYLTGEWQFHAIRSLEDGFTKVNDSSPTVFFFDDFLGRVELNQQALRDRESELAKFVRRIRKSKNMRFVLTTRAHIFEEARQVSDYVDDERLQLAKYLLDVGSYSRRIKSRILFNHISVAELSQEHISVLMDGKWLQKIVDHRNYNPRVISSVSSELITTVDPTQYPPFILAALDSPEQIWEKPYRALPLRSQNLLICLYFGDQFGMGLTQLRKQYDTTHQRLSRNYNQPIKPDDFESALKSLESGFISISGTSVSFINPSVRDFLKQRLNDEGFLFLLPSTAQRLDWALKVWEHVNGHWPQNASLLKQTAAEFHAVLPLMVSQPTTKQIRNQYGVATQADDLAFPSRMNFLIDLWEKTNDETFIQEALNVIQSPKVTNSYWGDGSEWPRIYSWAENDLSLDHPSRDNLLNGIQVALFKIIKNGLETAELTSTYNAIHEYMEGNLSSKTAALLDATVKSEFDDIEEIISHFSESELDDHSEAIKELGQAAGIDTLDAEYAISERMQKIEQAERERPPPEMLTKRQSRETQFSDAELQSLFGNLLRD